MKIFKAFYSIIFLTLALVIFFPGGAAQAEEQTFEAPSFKGVQIDWCKHWGAECGKPAADHFCKQEGYEAALKFEIAPDIGSPEKPTLVFGDGRICTGTFCDGFKFIQCTKKDALTRPKQSIVPQLSNEKTGEFPVPANPPEETEEDTSKKITVIPGIMTNTPPKPAPTPKDTLSKPGAGVASASNPQVYIPPEMLGGRPSLMYCQISTCEFTFGVDYKANPSALTQVQSFKTDFLQVKKATAARFEVSTYPISGALNATPKNIVLEGVVQNNGVFNIDLIKGRQNLGYLPGSFYVRVIALDKPGGQQVGAASKTMRIYYADNMPPPEPIQIFSDKVLSTVPAPNLELVSFDYRAYYFVENWPLSCKPIPRDTGTHGLEAAGKAAGKTWSAVSGVYAAAKSGVIDLASTLTLGYVPKSILELALNTALIAAGIPPEIPDLNKLMSEGAGYFASEMAKVAISQIPAGDLVAATGSLAADITIEMAADMTEQQLRDRLEDEIRKQSKKAIEQAAKKAEQDMLDNASKTYCRGKIYWPTYKVTLKNNGFDTARDVSLTVSDEAKLFEAKTVTFSLAAGESITIPLMPDPNVRVVQRSQLPGYDESANNSIWWNEDYKNKETRIKLEHSGATTCVDPLGPNTYTCNTGTVLLLRTPGRGTLNEDRKFK